MVFLSTQQTLLLSRKGTALEIVPSEFKFTEEMEVLRVFAFVAKDSLVFAGFLRKSCCAVVC